MTSDGYHRYLHFLILDLHKSEVGPSNLLLFSSFFSNLFFFQKSNFHLKIKKEDFSRPFCPSTPGLKVCCH